MWTVEPGIRNVKWRAGLQREALQGHFWWLSRKQVTRTFSRKAVFLLKKFEDRSRKKNHGPCALFPVCTQSCKYIFPLILREETDAVKTLCDQQRNWFSKRQIIFHGNAQTRVDLAYRSMLLKVIKISKWVFACI